jgi:hypothetical protein
MKTIIKLPTVPSEKYVKFLNKFLNFQNKKKINPEQNKIPALDTLVHWSIISGMYHHTGKI